MLINIEPVANLRGLARIKARTYEAKTIPYDFLDKAIAEGWDVMAKNKTSVRITRQKPHGHQLEDRVWTLLYRMGFTHLSGIGGATLMVDASDKKSTATQIDVIGIDDEIAVAIECKSAQKHSKRSEFQEELGKHALIQPQFANSINNQFAPPVKRKTVLAMFLSNIVLSESDRMRAQNAGIALFDEQDLLYYESLTGHLGPAAKYQFLADLLAGKDIPGLRIRVPAVKTTIGKYDCYTFSITPEYLLKISYVSHRSKGKASDVDTYQRMLNKSRLNGIKSYIRNNGIFPTNIVINLDTSRLRFEKIKQESDVKTEESGLLGWLEIRPSYKTAWIIDGQHRLFAYSGYEAANKSHLSVLAFAGLPPSMQAQLFIDINAKQKSVKQSLLQELYAELKWDADDVSARVSAIISKSIQVLDSVPDSALHQRIQRADSTKDAKRCISLTSIFSALDKTEFFVAKERQGHVKEYWPLWDGSNEATLLRTVSTIKTWLNLVRTAVPDWWDKGAGQGGGLAMNDGVTACINVLRSVFQHLDATGQRLAQLNQDDLSKAIEPYGHALGEYFQSLSEEERKHFRDLRGAQGQNVRTRRCQQAIHERIPSFNPPGLDEFLQQEKRQTNSRAKVIVDTIETTLQAVILDVLKSEFTSAEDQWWTYGVPRSIRKRVMERHEEDDGRRGGREFYFDLIDYRTIAVEHWTVFEPLLGYGKANMSKEKRTAWMNEVNEARKIVAHASSGVSISVDQLTALEQYAEWLDARITGRQEEVDDI